MTRSYRHGRRSSSAHSKTALVVESLEVRACPTADLASGVAAALGHLDWDGQSVSVRQDSWIVRTEASLTAERLGLPAGWQSTDLGEGFHSLRAAGAGAQDVLGWAARTAGVRYVEPDFAIAPNALPNDTSFSQLWGLHNIGQSGGVVDADIDAPDAWDTTTGSRNVVVAVIDTGVDYNHSDLTANVWRNAAEIAADGIDNDRNGFVDDVRGWDFANNDADPMDDAGHGTHVAGTIGAVGGNGVGVAGVNWQVSIMPLKFLGADGSGSTSAAIAALNYATRMRRDFGVNIVASNNSWGGGGFSTALRDAIDAGGRAGMLCVVAAGNEGTNNDTTPSYPASYAGTSIITVAATDRSNRLASFSNFGSTGVDLAAPGVSIFSTVPGNSYASYSGTSMATPHVTGAVALLAAANPDATAAEIRSAILSSTTPLTALQGKVATGGLLNVNAAVGAIGTTPTPTPTPTPIGPFEPNNSLATAASLTLSDGRGTITAAVGDGEYGSADVDLYSLRLEAGMRLTIDIDASSLSTPSALDSYVRLFDASGRQLAANDDDAGSTDSLLTVTVPTAGTYYVGISSYGNAAYDPRRAGSGRSVTTVGNYTATFTTQASTSADAGDSMAAAATVPAAPETRVTGTIGDGAYGRRDVDMYRVTLAAGQRLVIDVDARSLPVSSTLDSVLRVFDASRRQVAFNDDTDGSYDSLVSFTPRVAGTYYVGVSGFGNAAYNPARAGSGRSGSAGDYALVMRFDPLTTLPTRGGNSVRALGVPDDPIANRSRLAAFAALATTTASEGTAPRTAARRAR
jgi:subtilisin family serine protease